MAVNNWNLIQEVQGLNQILETSDTTNTQNRISSNLLGLFTNQPSIVLNDELINQLTTTRNLVDLGTRITTVWGTFPNIVNGVQTPLQVNNTNIPSTSIGAIATAANIQTQINTITNTSTPALDALPNQISQIRNRLNQNRWVLQQIEDLQIRRTNINNPVANRQTLNTNISNAQRNLNACTNISWILEQISSIEQNALLNEVDNLGRPTQRANALAGQLNTHRQTLTRNLTTQRANLPAAAQNIGATGNTQADITTLTNEQVRLNQDIINRNQQISSITEIQDIDRQIQTLVRSLTPTPIPTPQNFWLPNLQNTIVINRAPNPNATQQLAAIDVALTQIENLENTLPQIRQRYQANLNVLNQLLPLQRLQEYLNNINSTPGLTNIRGQEIQQIVNIGQQIFRLGQQNFNHEIPSQTIDMNGGIQGPIDLNTLFVPNGTQIGAQNYPIDYELANGDGQILTRVGINNNNNLQVTTSTGQTVTLTGIQIQNGMLNMTNVTVLPLEGIQFPLKLSLNVRGRVQDPATGLLVDQFKPLTLTINNPQLSLADRQNAYNVLNWWWIIDQRIAAEYSDHTREELENEVIRNILREGGNQTEIDTIYNDTIRRNLLIERIRAIPGLIPVIQLGVLQTGFMADMTREDRNVPQQYLLNQNTFIDYLRTTLGENVRNYVRWEIQESINNVGGRDQILRTLMEFQTDVVNNKVDNNDHLRALAAIPAGPAGAEPEAHSNSVWQRLRRRTSNKNNYTKFFQGREQSINDQSLETEEWTIKYGTHVEVLGTNKMTATITIEGKEEPEIIDWPNHIALVRAILERRSTKDGEPLNRKLRCRLALDIIKSVVMMSPQRLSREIPVTNFTDPSGIAVPCDRIDANVRNNNLIIRAGSQNPWGATARTRQNVTIFNEERYKNLHNINELEEGITHLSNQINLIMNSTMREYEQSVNNARNKSLVRYNTNQFWRFWPAKKLWGRVAYGKTNYDFNFTTSAQAGKKSVNITFNDGKFTLSWEFKGEKYEYSSCNLGSLLRKKIQRERVFNGLELEIVAQVNEAMVGRLRTNNMIGPENFAVSDLNNEKTGRVYIFDDAGNLSYLEIEDRALNPIPNGANEAHLDFNNVPPQRIRCNDQERKEFFQNPFLSGRLIRSMRRRLAAF